MNFFPSFSRMAHISYGVGAIASSCAATVTLLLKSVGDPVLAIPVLFESGVALRLPPQTKTWQPFGWLKRRDGVLARMTIWLIILLATFNARAEGTNGLSHAEIQGRKLADRIWNRLEERPTEIVTNMGALIIDGPNGRSSETPVQFRTTLGATSWSTTFETTADSNRVALVVVHRIGEPNRYELYHSPPRTAHSPKILSGNETMVPFAGSDFWVADLGLVFFHWPEQKILKPYEMRRGRSCHVLESVNPSPSPNTYSRVVSWIDNETLGIVQAKAYDVKGKLLKEFYPKDFKKVNGQWKMGEMEMINDQTDSRTWIKFNLKKRD